MSKLAIILGNQLFEQKHFKKLKADQFFMAEDLSLCTHYKYHKHKIVFFLAAMRKFAKEFDLGPLTYFDFKSKYFEKSYEDKLDAFLKKNKKIKSVSMFEVEDKFFEKKLSEYFKEKEIEIEFVRSPMFVVSRHSFKKYLNDYKKPFMKSFYENKRKEFKVLIDKDEKPEGGKWSYDSENRKKLPKDFSAPDIPQIKIDKTTKEICDFVEKKFSDHPGSTENFWIPTTRKESLKWLNTFLKERFEKFGDYQDSITNRSDFVFHSVLSPMINAGLLTPEEVITKAQKFYKNNNTPLNSTEGFIRQVLGWREFVRGIYQNFSEDQEKSNFWNNKNKLTKDWYNGSTEIEILDDAIKKAQKYSYTHHIERLMVISNMMLLCEIDPKEVHKWFMEMHSDSSDWVMGPNVYGLGQFSDGGIFATKPYICGSNYYRKMSRYSKDDWCDVVDGLYWRFIDKHKDFYEKNPRMSIMVKSLEKMDKERKKDIFKKAETFIKKVTQ